MKTDELICGGARTFAFAITVAVCAALVFAAHARTGDVMAHGARPEWGIVLEQDGSPHPVRLNGARMPCDVDVPAPGVRRFRYGALTDGNQNWNVQVELEERATSGGKTYTGRIANNANGIRVTAFEGPYFERVRVDPRDAALYVPCGLGHRERAFPRANDKDVKPLPSPDFVPTMWRPTTWYALKDGRYTYDTCFHPGVGLTMPWLALSSEGRTLYAGAHDVQARPKRMRVRWNPEENRADVAFDHRLFLPSGGTYTLPETVFETFDGDWHAAAKRYRRWYDATWKVRAAAPDWTKDVTGWLLVILKQQNEELMWPYTDIPKLCDVAERNGLNCIGLFGWTVGGHDHLYPDYDPDPKMGGVPALKAGIAEAHRRGIRVCVYANGQLQQVGATRFWDEHGKNLALVMKDGKPVIQTYHKYRDIPEYQFALGCLYGKPWFDRMYSLAEQAESFGADAILYDQLGVFAPFACYGKGHGHPTPHYSYSEERPAFIRRLADGIQKRNPNFAVLTEGLHDTVLDSIGMFHGCEYGTFVFDAGKQIPARATGSRSGAFPELWAYTFPELVTTMRFMQPMLSRTMANIAVTFGFRHDIEVRYMPDRAYVLDGKMPTKKDYGTVVNVPDIGEMTKVSPAEASAYLKSVCDFQRAHAKYLMRGRFVDDEGFTCTDPALTAKRFVAADGTSAVCVWNMSDKPVDVKLSGLGDAASVQAPAGTSAQGPLAANSLRLYVFGGVASAAPRTLDVSAVDSRYFADANGKTFIPVGCNICFPRMYDAASPGARAACEEKFFGWLRAFAANGGNFVRLWLGHPFFEIMPDQAGKYDPAAEATLKKTVALCEELNIKLKLTLESFRTVHPAGKEGKGMYSAFFNRPLYAPYAKNMREFLHSEKCARIYLGKAQRLKELGLGDSPAVACWELWNEINCIGPWRGDVGPWSDRMLEQLRVMFPRQMTVQNLGSFSGPSAYDYYDYLGRIPLNHFMQVHRYLDPGAELDICRGPMDVLAADSVKELLDRRPDAPAVLAEVGAVKPNHTGPSELYAKDKLGMLLHDEIFAPFFAGSAGCGQPWHWDHQYVDGNNLWWHFARFAMAVKGIDPALEHFRPFHTETRRLRVWGLCGMNTTLLWCRDKANTWESELVRGEPPATISGEKIPFAKSFVCYLPWENRWVDAGKDGTLPDFKRSIVVRIMHETEWEKSGTTPAPLTSCGRAAAWPSHGEPPSRRLTGTTGVSPVDCSLAVPDELVKQISFRVDELRSVSNAHCKVYSVDFSDDAQYRAAGAQKFFEKRQEDGKAFVRFGLKGKTAFAGGICPAKPFAVCPNTQYTLKFSGRCPQGRCLMYLRLFDEKGKNVSASVMVPKGWAYTKYNIAIYRLSDQSSAKWHEEEVAVQIPEGVHAVLPVLSTSFDGKAEWYDCRDLTFTEKPRSTLREKITFQRREIDGDGSLVLTSDAASLRLKASLAKDDAGMVKVSVDVADTSVPPRPRALDVALEWKHDLTGWTWHKDWRNDSTVGKDSFLHNFKNITGIPVGIYPFTAVSRDGKGVAIGTALDDPAFEYGVVTQGGITSRRALGLLKRGAVGTSAKLDWLVFSFSGTWGFRSAAKKYYASQARKIPVVANGAAKEGMRSYLGVNATQLPENVDDFGLAYFIPGGSKAERARARELGMAVHPYILAWQMPTHHFKDYSVMPPMEDRIAELKSWLPITNEKGHRNFKSKSDLAKLVLGSMPLQADGTHPLSLEWYDGVVHYWRLNVDPRLPAPSAASHFFDVIKSWGMDTIDGVYLDNVYVQNFNNVRPDHLAVMTEPLVYDPETAQPCAHAMQHQVAFVKALGDWLHPLGKSISGNVFAGGSYRFNATLIDVFGSETGCWGSGKNRDERLISGEAYPDDGACEKRFFAYNRPVSDMLQDGNWTTPAPAITAEGVAGYVEHHLFYGFYPSIVTIGGEDSPGYRGWKRYFGPSRQCERDRALFKKAVPLLRRINKAGWQPETLVRARNPKVLVERYGGFPNGGECLITVRNASKDPVETELVLDPELMYGEPPSRRLEHGEPPSRRLIPLWQGGAPLDGEKGVFKVRLGPWRTEVYLAKPVVRDVMEPLPPGAVKLTGGLEVPIEKSIAHWHKGNVPYREFAEFFRKGRPKFALGEMWGKFVRSGAMQYRHRRDPELKAVLDGAVADILATERPNGSISCVPEELQPGGDGHSRPHCSDLWERKYVMLALEDYYEWVGRRPEVLASLQRQADCIIRQVGPAPKRDIREIGWSPNCIESSSLLEPFMRLYKLTGRKEYLDFARYIIESGGAKGSDLFAQARAGVMPWRMGEPYPKAYEMTSIFEGLAEWHRVTGDASAREAVLKYFDSVLRHEITIVGNGGGNYPHWPRWSGEAWDNTAAEQSNPDMTRMMETCVGVTWMKYASQVLRLTGDVRAADAIELYVYNGLLGAMKPDGDGFSYVNLLNGEKVTNKGWGWTFASGPVTCCNLNGPMGLAYIPFVAVMQAQDGPVVNLYNAGTAVAQTASGAEVRLVAEGDLLDMVGRGVPDAPWRMTVSPSRAESFTISLRIPAWSEKTTVTVNGESVGAVAPGKYLKITRTWRAGDKVAVAFDFKARKLDASVGRNHASAPFQAVTWGPIALARDENTDPNYAAPVAIQAAADGTVAVERITPTSPAHKLEFRVPTKDGFITMCDYASVDGWKGKHVQTWLPKASGK